MPKKVGVCPKASHGASTHRIDRGRKKVAALSQASKLELHTGSSHFGVIRADRKIAGVGLIRSTKCRGVFASVTDCAPTASVVQEIVDAWPTSKDQEKLQNTLA